MRYVLIWFLVAPTPLFVMAWLLFFSS